MAVMCVCWRDESVCVESHEIAIESIKTVLSVETSSICCLTELNFPPQHFMSHVNCSAL